KLVVEFWSRCRVSIRQVEATYDQSIDAGFNITAMHVIGITGQYPPNLHRLFSPRQYCYPVPALLTMPDSVVASFGDGLQWKFLLRCFQLLQAYNIRGAFLEPSKEYRQSSIYTIYVVSCYFHHQLIS